MQQNRCLHYYQEFVAKSHNHYGKCCKCANCEFQPAEEQVIDREVRSQDYEKKG